MSLYRRGRLWWIKLNTASGVLRRSAGTADKKAAWEFHEKVKEQTWRQERLGERTVTWGEAVRKWLEVRPRGLPDRYRIASFGFSSTEALPLSVESCTSLLRRNTTAASAGSWNRSLALLVAIHNVAGVKPPDVPRRKMPPGRTRWLREAEWIRLLKALEEESPLLAQAARFAIATGLRENNVLNLRWDQVDIKRAVAFIEAAETKQKAPIGVSLTPDAVAVLRERRGSHRVFVFAHPDSGKPLYKASNRAWYKAVRKAKLKGFRWHDLRHTWASWAIQSGVRIEELQQLGGWKTLQMVQRYSHLSPDHLKSVAAKIRPIK
jgi:integrase